MKRFLFAATAALAIATATVGAQTQQYKYGLAPAGGPAPRTADGHVDLSGVWWPNRTGIPHVENQVDPTDKFGVDPLFFGLLVALNLQTAFLSPPVERAKDTLAIEQTQGHGLSQRDRRCSQSGFQIRQRRRQSQATFLRVKRIGNIEPSERFVLLDQVGRNRRIEKAIALQAAIDSKSHGVFSAGWINVNIRGPQRHGSQHQV